ncbi:MAG: hypothetical protein ABR499_16795 [Gemmatimonadaceae bacterium]
MARTRKPKPAARRDRGPKKAKTYRLSEQKIAAAQAILGAKTATAAIETALDMVVFRKELVEGTAAMLGADLTAPFEPA